MSRKSRKNVGVIGLGIIGSRVAAGLRAVGYQVYVWNRTAKPVPNFLGSPAEVAEAADVVQIFVADAPALFEVLEQMGDSLTAKHVIICSATVGPEAVLEAAQVVESKGAQFLDAPFTGSKGAAEKRQLVYYIGGSEHTLVKVEPILQATSKSIVKIGEVGHAASVKVVTNMISAVTTQVLAEALSIVQKAGLEPEVLAAAIEHNACRSGVIDLKLPKMVTGDYEPHFSLKHMFKDVQLGIHMANALDIEIPATTVTAGVMYGALNKGWADLDYAAVFKNYEAPEPEDSLPSLPPARTPDELAAEAAEARRIAALMAPEKSEPVETPVESKGNIIAIGAPATDAVSTGAPEAKEDFKEATPSAAAAQIIEAVLSSGVVDEPPVESAPDARGKEPASGTEASEGQKADGGSKDSKDAPATEVKTEQTDAEKTGENGAEPKARPNNFVRRWFVAR
jgi:3-hydroxyisobutyrate dehydrogenase-like beta-hydroxyacid dehydrogenase